MRKGFALAAFALIGFQNVANSDSTRSWTFEEIAATAGFIGVLEVSGLPEPASDGACGLWINVRVVERITGAEAPSRILVENGDDLLAGHDRYLVFAFPPADGDRTACTPSSDSLVVPAVVQVMFPFGEESDRRVDGLELLAWRESAFSFNGAYLPNEFVDRFAVINGRLFAVIRWPSVRSKLLDFR